jgi:NB-ARC domain
VFDRGSLLRIENLKDLISWVGQEAYLVREAVKDQTQEDTHNQILQIVMSLGRKTDCLPYQNIPHIRNQAFHGQTALLAVISNRLGEQNRKAGLAQVALFGLGGVGKTQIALEYAHGHFQDYEAIFWVNAETNLKLAESFGAQAIALGLGNGDSPEQHDQWRAIFKKWLLDCGRPGLCPRKPASRAAKVDNRLGTTGESIPWLMIFDNVEDVATLEQYWPKGALGSIMLTTRNPIVAKTYAPCSLEVPSFTRKESEEYLYMNSSDDQNNSLEANAAAKMASSAGDSPLALGLVASYASSIACSYHVFLQQHPEIDRDFLFQVLGDHLRSPQAYRYNTLLGKDKRAENKHVKRMVQEDQGRKGLDPRELVVQGDPEDQGLELPELREHAKPQEYIGILMERPLWSSMVNF